MSGGPVEFLDCVLIAGMYLLKHHSIQVIDNNTLTFSRLLSI